MLVTKTVKTVADGQAVSLGEVDVKVEIIPSLILRAWKNNDYWLGSTNVPYYESYSSEIPELETNSISIYDARYLSNGDSYDRTEVYIMIETNSDGAVSINQEFSDYADFYYSIYYEKYFVSLYTSPGGMQDGITVTKDLIITVGETDTYEELSKTLSITFVNGTGIMDEMN